MPMQFVIGLGNPGEKYARTRHNVGFMVVEMLATELAKRLVSSSGAVAGLPNWQMQSKFSAEICKLGDVYFAKPQTFMNESGRAVRALVEYFDADAKRQLVAKNESLSLPQLFICHDDLDLAVGSYKIQFGTGPKIHNGLRSIDATLGTDQYWHVRIGVDGRNGDRSQPAQDYVLSHFSPAEQTELARVFAEVTATILAKLEV